MANIQRWINAHGQPATQVEIDVTPNDFTKVSRQLIKLIGEEKYNVWVQTRPLKIQAKSDLMLAALEAEVERLMRCACSECSFRRDAIVAVGAEKVRLEMGVITLPDTVSASKAYIERMINMAHDRVCMFQK